MKKSSFFFTMLFMNGFRFGLLLLFAVILIVIGVLWVDVCLYIGLGVLALYVVICVCLSGWRVLITISFVSGWSARKLSSWNSRSVDKVDDLFARWTLLAAFDTQKSTPKQGADQNRFALFREES